MAGTVRCQDLAPRIANLLAHPDPLLNGIDYVQIDPDDHTHLWIVMLRSVVPADGYGLVAEPSALSIRGGVRITGIHATSVTVPAADRLEVRVNVAGDHSAYVLTLPTHPELDRPLSQVTIDFTATCPSDTDCEPVLTCPAPDDEPLIDYLARDYSSFVRLLTDVAATRHGSYSDGSVPDLAQSLIELFAYKGDHLAWFQDAVATEYSIDTARLPRSLRRLGLLVDYRVGTGRNAATWVVFSVTAAGTVPKATPLLTRIPAPLHPGEPVPGTVIDPSWLDPGTPEAFEANPALEGVVVFETAHDQQVSPANNEIHVHTWGNDDCFLGEGSTEAWLYGVEGTTAVAPDLAAGDFLVFEEARGRTGAGWPADADPGRRAVVRITEVVAPPTYVPPGPVPPDADPVYSNILAAETDPGTGIRQLTLRGLAAAGDTPLPLLHVRWQQSDALPFGFCLSATQPDGHVLRDISVARGNVAAADHGRTVHEALDPVVPGHVPVELRLSRGPLTVEVAAPDGRYDNQTGRPVTGRWDLGRDHPTVPAVAVKVTTPARSDAWTAVPDLLDSTPFDHHVVAEPGGPATGDSGGAVPPVPDADLASAGPGVSWGEGAIVRFGDGAYGSDPSAGWAQDEVSYLAMHRVGNGPAGNIGAEALVHAALPGNPGIVGVRNPLPAAGGAAPEPAQHVRVAAPVAFAADQLRAVTEDDYAAAVLKLPTVRSAVATFRWTGSWLTVFVGAEPANPVDLVVKPDGRFGLSDTLVAQVTGQLERYRQAGYDLEILAPTYIALDVVLDVCVAAGYFRSDVVDAVRRAMGSGWRDDGSPAFFNQVNWTFGQPVWISSLYAAAEQVPGVQSVEVQRLRRLGQGDNGELAAGKLETGPWEIVRCDSDPNFAEHGTLTMIGHGGKG